MMYIMCCCAYLLVLARTVLSQVFNISFSFLPGFMQPHAYSTRIGSRHMVFEITIMYGWNCKMLSTIIDTEITSLQRRRCNNAVSQASRYKAMRGPPITV